MAKRSKNGKRSPPKTRKEKRRAQEAAEYRARQKNVTAASEQADEVLRNHETTTETPDTNDTVSND